MDIVKTFYGAHSLLSAHHPSLARTLSHGHSGGSHDTDKDKSTRTAPPEIEPGSYVLGSLADRRIKIQTLRCARSRERLIFTGGSRG